MKFYISDDNGNTYHELGELQEISAESVMEEESDEAIKGLLSSKSMEFSCDIDEKSSKKLNRLILTKGQRNAIILKRDGYLSPENADRW